MTASCEGPFGAVYTAGGTVWPLDLDTFSVGPQFEVGGWINDVAVSPDGRWVAAGLAA